MLILCTLGTRGDIDPFLRIAQHARAAGAKVQILSNKNWRHLVEETGAEFIAIGEADPSQSGRDDRAFFKQNIYPTFKKCFSHVAEIVANGINPVLGFRTTMLGMECAADVFGLPHGQIALQPSAIRSAERPSWPITPLSQGIWASVGRSAIVPSLYLLADLLSPYRRDANRFRTEVGLATKSFMTSTRTDRPTAILAPDWFCLPQPDWPIHSQALGFPFKRASEEDPDALTLGFLEEHGAPVVLTPGTGVTDTGLFLSYADRITTEIGAPTIVLSTAASAGLRRKNVLVRPFVDLQWLLGRARAIVHHGGIGTTAQAVRAGIPQLVLAGRFDQPDNAVRVAQLGLGGAILKDRPSPNSVCKTLRKVLSASHVAAQVRIAADLVRQDDGARRTAEWLLELN